MAIEAITANRRSELCVSKNEGSQKYIADSLEQSRLVSNKFMWKYLDQTNEALELWGLPSVFPSEQEGLRNSKLNLGLWKIIFTSIVPSYHKATADMPLSGVSASPWAGTEYS